MAVHAVKHLSLFIDMMDIQRLLYCVEVKPQVYGGRKIQLLKIKDEEIVCSRSEKKWRKRLRSCVLK